MLATRVFVVASAVLPLSFASGANYDEYTTFCLGKKNDGVCGISLKMSSTCNARDSGISCLCTSGYLAVDQACSWCKQAHNYTDFDDASYLSTISSRCSQSSFTIAPMPSSIKNEISSFNATITSDATTSGVNKTAKSSLSSPAEATTYYGGTLHTRTYYGGGDQTPTDWVTNTGAAAAGQTTATKSGARSTAESGARGILAFSILSSGISLAFCALL